MVLRHNYWSNIDILWLTKIHALSRSFFKCHFSQSTTFHAINRSLRALLGRASFSDFPCFREPVWGGWGSFSEKSDWAAECLSDGVPLLFFSQLDWHYGAFGGEHTGKGASLSHPNKDAWYQQNLSVMPRTFISWPRLCLPDFLTIKYTTRYSLEGSHFGCRSYMRMGNYVPSPAQWSSYKSYSEFFHVWDSPSLPTSLIVQSLIYINFWVLTLYSGLFSSATLFRLLRLFQFWALAVL